MMGLLLAHVYLTLSWEIRHAPYDDKNYNVTGIKHYDKYISTYHMQLQIRELP
jgi:hypothetical protein